jgi:hypothetical protein
VDGVVRWRRVDPVAIPCPGTQPGRKHLAIHAGQLALKPRVRNLRCHRRHGLRGMAKAHCTTGHNHLNRDASVGPCRSNSMTVGIRPQPQIPLDRCL